MARRTRRGSRNCGDLAGISRWRRRRRRRDVWRGEQPFGLPSVPRGQVYTLYPRATADLLSPAFVVHSADFLGRKFIEFHQQRRIAEDGRNQKARIVITFGLHDYPRRMYAVCTTKLKVPQNMGATLHEGIQQPCSPHFIREVRMFNHVAGHTEPPSGHFGPRVRSVQLPFSTGLPASFQPSVPPARLAIWS